MSYTIPSDVPLYPAPSDLTSDFDHPVDDQRWAEIIAIFVIFVFFSTLCVLARVWCRLYVIRIFSWDDGFAVASLILNIGLTVCWAGEINNGIADYDWNIRKIDWINNDEYYWFIWTAVAVIFLYAAFATVKLSILMLYLRLLDKTQRWLRIYVYVNIFCVVAFNFGCIVGLLKFCSPTAKLFNPIILGTCSQSTELFFVQSLGQVISDFAILVPPIPLVWGLKTPMAKKIKVALTLCTGIIVTAVGIARTVFLNPNNDNSTTYLLYGEFLPTLWCMVEINLSIIVICLPALNPALNRLFRQVVGVSRKKSSPIELAYVDPADSMAGLKPKDGSSVRRDLSSLGRTNNGLYSELDDETGQDKYVLSTLPTAPVVSAV